MDSIKQQFKKTRDAFNDNLQFGWRLPSEVVLRDIGPEIDGTYMSDETTRGFTGTMIGMACVDSYRRTVIADFEFFDLQHGSHLD